MEESNTGQSRDLATRSNANEECTIEDEDDLEPDCPPTLDRPLDQAGEINVLASERCRYLVVKSIDQAVKWTIAESARVEEIEVEGRTDAPPGVDDERYLLRGRCLKDLLV